MASPEKGTTGTFLSGAVLIAVKFLIGLAVPILIVIVLAMAAQMIISH